MNLYSWSLIESGFLLSPSVKRFVGGEFGQTVMHVVQDSGEWGVDVKLWNDLWQKVQNKLASRTLDAHQNLKEHLDHGKILFKLAGEVIDKDLSQWTTKRTIAWLKLSWDHYIELNALGFLAVVSDFDHNLLSNSLARILEKHSTPANPTQKYLAALISPNRPDLNWIELLDLLEIVRKYKTLNKITASAEFRRHAKKYKWLNYGYQGPLGTTDDFALRAKKLLADKKSIRQIYLEHKSQFEVIKQNQARIERHLKLTDHERYMFDQARTLMFTKAYRLNVRHAIQYAFELMFVHLGKQLALPLTFFRYCLREEILQLLTGHKVDTVEIIKRRNGVLKIVDRHKTRFIPARQIDQTLRKVLEKETVVKQDFVDGQVAFAGRARGRARLVFGIPDLGKVTHGDILVAVTTTPDVLPAMSRAIAFVTDSGGITSHAAIVAREMKKPCVIGTKFATKIFKDGDMIEVDANKGTVRKI